MPRRAPSKRHLKQNPKKSDSSTMEKAQMHKAPPLFRDDAFKYLSRSLYAVYKKRGIPQKNARMLIHRLSLPLRLMGHLHVLALGAIAGEIGAARRFDAHIEDLASRCLDSYDAVGQLRERTGWARHNRHCGAARQMMPLNGSGAIYLSAFLTRAGDAKSLERAFNTIARLSLGHGHLEVLHSSLLRGGLEGLQDAVDWGFASGNPYFDVNDPRVSGDGSLQSPGPGIPHSDQPVPDDPDWGMPSLDHPLLACDPFPPMPNDDEFIRQGCEGLLVEILNNEAPNFRYLGRRAAWAEGIDSIELSGACGGDSIVIHGHGFGEPQPDNTALVVTTQQGCMELAVPDDQWTDTRIETILPNDILSGPVGFYDRLGLNEYNHWVNDLNQTAANILAASRCLEAPLIFPTLRPILAVPCPPETDSNIIVAGVPVIRTFQAGNGTTSGATLIIDPDDTLMLTWTVDNADSLILYRTTAAGPSLPDANVWGDTEYTSVSGSSIDLGVSGHTEIGEYRFQLQARNSCNPSPMEAVTAEVVVIASKRPELTIDDIEVTQGIQTPDHDVALVTGKATAVRVFASHRANTIGIIELPNVTGKMRIFNDEFPLGTSWMAPINGSTARPPDPSFGVRISLPAAPDRGRTGDTLNFLIPEGLCEGTIDIEVKVRFGGFDTGPGAQDFAETVVRRFEGFSFTERRPLHIRYIPVTIEPDTAGTFPLAPGISNPPTNDECVSLIRESLQQIPTTAASISRHTGYAIHLSAQNWQLETPFGTFSRPLGFDIFANAHLEWIGLIRICGTLDLLDLVCEEDASIWAIIVPVSRLWGRAHIGGLEYITPYRASTAAHELAHCMNQLHLGVQCENGQTAPGGDDPADFPGGGTLEDVPFDILNNRAVNGTVFDIMTYCSDRWVSPQRWQQMFDFIGGPP